MRKLQNIVSTISLCAFSGALLAHQAASKPPVIQAKLANVVVTTLHLETQAAFYENMLGFKSFFRNKTCCFLKTGGANLVFVDTKDKGKVTKNLCLDVAVQDLAAAQTALTAGGIQVDATDPAVLKFTDPDGNLVEVVHG